MPLGIPHSQFLAWSEADQAKALAWQRWQREKCPGCGTRKAEWQADRFAYVGTIEHCDGCEVAEQEAQNIPERERQSRANRVGLLPRRVAEQQMSES